jgi:hypothetical protein
MITGWLASQSLLLKRGQVDLTELTEDQTLGIGVCRLCGVEPETNWHVHARCTHPDVVAERRAVALKIQQVLAALQLPASASKILACNWLLDNEGRAHDLSDAQELRGLLADWAPDIAHRAEHIQSTLVWNATQGPNRDNLRRWSFRGLMLDHWATLLAEMGVSRRASTAALDQLEKEVLRSLPSVWGVFSTLVHEPDSHDNTAKELANKIDAFFSDWALDQGPMTITRAEIGQLTMRARGRWLQKARRTLKKRRKGDANRTRGTQALITRYLPIGEVSGTVMEAARAAQHRNAVHSLPRRKRRRWLQQTLRDMGLHPTPNDALQRPGPDLGRPPRKSRRRVEKQAELPPRPPRAPPPPRVPLDQRSQSSSDRRRRDKRRHRVPQPNGPRDTSADTTMNTTGETARPTEPDIRRPTDQEEAQYAVFERPTG